MSSSLFITLYDEKTLALYLDKGIYGFLMPPLYGQPSPQSNHFAALADYACTREGTHVFFFLKRKIIYGGTVIGSKTNASFYINGQNSPLGLRANAPLFWDESSRYTSINNEGVFIVNEKERCQPFILLFKSNEKTRKEISSDDLYFELGKYPYPLPSNSIQGMGFCTLTPGETEIALELFKTSKKHFEYTCRESLFIKKDKTLFNPCLGIQNLSISEGFSSESFIEFSLLSNIDLLPEQIRPSKEMILCRQVPISPFKPFQMDRADICIFDTTHSINNGTIPNIIVELKKDRANFHAYNQVHRYLLWLERILNGAQFQQVTAFLLAPDFYINSKKINRKHIDMIRLIKFDGNEYMIS